MNMFQVDAFTDRVFSGNPAAVLVLENWLDDEMMLALAEENNLAETAFAVPRTDGEWDLRWFAPLHEVDFCGHATLATAHVLASEFGVKGTMTFRTRVGLLKVAQREAGYQLDIPALPPEALTQLPKELDCVFENEPAKIFRNFENIFVDVGSEREVRDFVPDLMRIAQLGPVGLVVTGRGDGRSGAAFVSRYFAPGAGIPEDHVTGSTHATLVPYWSEVLGAKGHRAFQASKRGGWLDCELVGDRVTLVGNAVTFMEASIRLPQGSTVVT
ncbi:MAG: PhzF family phenazine biosynthesis protein [Parvularcula sp.]|jgi:PhzF family phenazine biosynthesis protein|nr:PhzF family phenazine biosynthesis protein [Parvularcula sp.]